jgi:hypothetical protein
MGLRDMFGRKERRVGSHVEKRSPNGALVAVAPIAPVAAALVAVGLEVGGVARPLLAGTAHLLDAVILLMVVWLTLAVLAFVLDFTSADRASMGTFGELIAALNELEAWQTVLSGPEHGYIAGSTHEAALTELRTQCAAIQSERAERTARWVMGTAYIKMLQRLHRAQEALISVEPIDAVIQHARYDLTRISGSNMANHAGMATQLEQAVAVLERSRLASLNSQLVDCLNSLSGSVTPPVSPEIVRGSLANAAGALDSLPGYFDKGALSAALLRGAQLLADPVRADQFDRSGLSRDLAASVAFLTQLDRLASAGDERIGNADADSNAQQSQATAQALSVVRTVRRLINDFRDSSRAGLLRERNQLALTVGITGITGYTLVWLAILSGASAETLEVGTAFYLSGAAVGLFARLYVEAKSETGVDDFGLSMIRMLAAPLLSGVAGLAGVVLLTVAPGVAAIETPFSLARLWPNMVTAAVFGLTPGLLIDRLSAKADEFKKDLKSTQASATASKTP